MGMSHLVEAAVVVEGYDARRGGHCEHPFPSPNIPTLVPSCCCVVAPSRVGCTNTPPLPSSPVCCGPTEAPSSCPGFPSLQEHHRTACCATGPTLAGLADRKFLRATD